MDVEAFCQIYKRSSCLKIISKAFPLITFEVFMISFALFLFFKNKYSLMVLAVLCRSG